MKLAAAFLGLAALASQATNADAKPATKLIEWNDAFENSDEDGPQNILGGEYIEPGSRPWLVPVVGRYFCGGSLISPSVVMTTAHCVVSLTDDAWHPPAWVEFNRYDWFNDTDVKRVYIDNRDQCDGDVVYHPYFNEDLLENDVALIFLPEPVMDVMPVQLNEDKNVPKADDQLDVAGWGMFDINIPRLNAWGPEAVTLNYVPNDACTKKPYRWREEWIVDSSMCAIGDEAPKSGCIGDSGGAVNLVKSGKNGDELTNIQVGIVSWGYYKCYHRAFPNVFTRVSEIADWVKETVCARKGELCKQSKAGKMSKKEKKYPDTCVPVSTMAPSTPFPTGTPSLTPQPWSPWPTYSNTTWPTWMPTTTPGSKSGKE
jgi:secreted trypsin-like serine protease